VRTRISARAPVRIDFGGGWTDVPFFAESEEGAVLNAAIVPGVRGEMTREGGVRVSYGADSPSGAGLGTSAALNVCWLALVNAALGTQPPPKALAEQAFRLESLLGVIGGRQDQYAAALGGINYLRFDAQGVQVQPLRLAEGTSAALRSRLLLCHTGEARLSGDIHRGVWDRYRSGDQEVARALRRLRDIAGEQRDALASGDLDAFGDLLGENWSCQKELHPAITNPTLDSLLDLALGQGAQAGKACGAGGGGCVVLLCRPGYADRLREAVAGRGFAIIDFELDFEGVVVTRG
jgi:D-glycero-alpha-D-manno-heptose-7-phosphate kinase